MIIAVKGILIGVLFLCLSMFGVGLLGDEPTFLVSESKLFYTIGYMGYDTDLRAHQIARFHWEAENFYGQTGYLCPIKQKKICIDTGVVLKGKKGKKYYFMENGPITTDLLGLVQQGESSTKNEGGSAFKKKKGFIIRKKWRRRALMPYQLNRKLTRNEGSDDDCDSEGDIEQVRSYAVWSDRNRHRKK